MTTPKTSSQLRYGVHQLRDVMIPMRDGTRLAMRLVTPDEGEGPWPALFQQRYGNDGSDPGGMDDMKELASHGFAVGLVLFRGAWQSEGEWNGYACSRKPCGITKVPSNQIPTTRSLVGGSTVSDLRWMA